MFILGLTGSIGMGKSTTAALFAAAGVAVHDSDGAVHDLYSGSGIDLIESAFPGTVVGGRVDRSLLAARVLNNAPEMARLEAIVHPRVGLARKSFLCAARERGDQIVVLDVPLLFEIGGDRDVDAVVVVTAPAHVQRERVLARPGMTVEKFESILARQIPDEQKRARAHFLISTDRGVDNARRRVDSILRAIAHIQAAPARELK